jgi:acyl-coenzyme A synthetase/AMP-(fatty) acid ligase
LILLPNGLSTTLQRYQNEFDVVVTKEHVVLQQAAFIKETQSVEAAELFIDDDAEIVFYTSGSSGKPKQVLKTVRILFDEIKDTSKLADFANCQLIVSTVPHQHLYGLLFRIIASVFNRVPFYSAIVRYPSEMSNFEHFVLVSSPAFLSRLDEDDAIEGAHCVLSSGGPLDLAAGKRVVQIFGCQGYEIFGSTETGGIAYRQLTEENIFTPLPGVQVSKDENSQLQVLSNYLLTH